MILHSERAKLCLLFAVRAGNFIEWIPVDKLKTCTAIFLKRLSSLQELGRYISNSVQVLSQKDFCDINFLSVFPLYLSITVIPDRCPNLLKNYPEFLLETQFFCMFYRSPWS